MIPMPVCLVVPLGFLPLRRVLIPTQAVSMADTTSHATRVADP